MTLTVRLATEADLAAIDEIYNHYVATSTCTMQEEPGTAEQRRQWFAARGERYPATVAELDGQVAGWACLWPWAERRGYRFSVENSVYVRHDLHRRGIGRVLLADTIERARALSYRTIVAKISADQPASLELHQKFGFSEVGRLREIGFKFGRWLDVVYLELMLGS